MHWLYFQRDSPALLEAAGFDYDSTWGYNDAVGYRAGTSQVFRLPASKRLMELPLSIMDSALLFHGRMGLSTAEALQRCRGIVANATQFGGTVVINWHDRSLAPERLWGACYEDLLKEVETDKRVWFTTAGRAVDWYRWRRSIRFGAEGNSREITVTAPVSSADLPGAIVRTHRPSGQTAPSVSEARLDHSGSLKLSLAS